MSVDIHKLAEDGDIEGIRSAALAGVDIRSLSSDSYHSNIIHSAASGGQTSIIPVLIKEYGVDPKAVDTSGRNAAHRAVVKGYFSTGRMLVDDYEVDINQLDSKGRTYLEQVMKLGYTRQVDNMVLFGAVIKPSFPTYINAFQKFTIMMIAMFQYMSLTYITDVPYSGAAATTIISCLMFTMFDISIMPTYITWYWIMLGIALCFVLLVSGCVRSKKFSVGVIGKESFLSYFLRSFAHIVATIGFTPIAKALIQVWDCTDGYLDADPTVLCWTGMHMYYATSSAIIAYPFLYCIFKMAKCNNTLSGVNRLLAPMSKFSFNFMMKRQRSRVYEYTQLTARVVLLTAVITLTTRPVLATSIACFTSLVLLACALRSAPYFRRSTNAFLVGLLAMSIWCDAIALLISLSPTRQSSVMFVAGMLPALLIGVVLGYYLCNNDKKPILPTGKYSKKPALPKSTEMQVIIVK